jgi:uncharacterized protein (TIGR02996 family)
VSSRAELEQLLEANPYDAETYRVYADVLQQEGDPRGELIQLQLAGEDAAAKQLIERRSDELLGPLVDFARDIPNGERIWWRFGFIHKLRVQNDMAGELARVRAHPSGRFLVELEIGCSGIMDANLKRVVALLAEQPPPTLRVLKLGIPWRPDPDFNFWFQGDDISALWPRLPQLRRLVVNGGLYGLGELDLPELETCSIQTGGLNPGNASAVARGVLPKLEFLEVCGDHDDSIETVYLRNGISTVSRTAGTFADIAPLLERTDLPRLRHLGIRNSLFTDEICGALASSALLSQLDELDLHRGTMTDAGARALAANPAAFAHLRRLDVSRNMLSQDGIAAIARLCRRVVTDRQDNARRR